MKRKHLAVMIVPASLAVVMFLLFMNDVVISIRLDELRSGLQEIDRREGSIDSIGLVATYDIHKKLFEKRITQAEADSIEQRINSIAVTTKHGHRRADTAYALLSVPALAVINFNRRVLGKRPLAYFGGDTAHHAHADLAYYYERNFHYKRAIELYDESLRSDRLDSATRAGVILHQGYCCALAGLPDRARKNYLEVINEFSQESSAITATVLLRYLEGFRLARERVLGGKGDPIRAGQDLVNLLAYEQALSILASAEREARPGDLPRIQYYKARCFAGMGETGRAVEHYVRVITTAPSSEYAKFSNRKLFIAGSSAGRESIRKMSIELNGTLKDPVLTDMIREGNGAEAGIAAGEDRIEVDVPQGLQDRVDGMISKDGKPGETLLVVHTSDGNIFRGRLIEQTTGRIVLMSSIGKIEIKKEKVTRITKQ